MYTVGADQPVATQPFMEQLSVGMSRAENALSYIARIPVVGTAAGVTKVAMGVLQTVAATAGMVIGLFSQIFDNKKILAYSLDHLQNGLGNILAGTLEAIPLAGTVSWYLVRKHHCQSEALIAEQCKFEDSSDTEEVRERRLKDLAKGNLKLANRRVEEVFSDFSQVLDSQEIKFVHYNQHPEQRALPSEQ